MRCLTRGLRSQSQSYHVSSTRVGQLPFLATASEWHTEREDSVCLHVFPNIYLSICPFCVVLSHPKSSIPTVAVLGGPGNASKPLVDGHRLSLIVLRTKPTQYIYKHVKAKDRSSIT
ncbi:hypothetical protein AG1IA_00884 [Rhizoctonia solani AG-1 IA]|uniref:Uncharacterized protein n=1 Tax=Thanatephorus cucumeris (strain AG1-IA) TaxID=983506 RepID=L8X7N8_THACA|nr:hypothetical protein AG1IA_00884 [Rhizoctonia solani AG-1 IA]